MAPSLSIVVTTYEWPEALNVVLRGLAQQSDDDFEVVVADDGSGPSTSAIVERWRTPFSGRLCHVWQRDEGFRLAHARNLGAARAAGSYLVFLDGDCIPRRRFVAATRRAALPGWFLAGKRVQLSPELSQSAMHDDVRLETWSTLTLLRRPREIGPSLVHLLPRDRRRPWRTRLPDFAPQENSYGFLTCVARSDFERVDGFDMRFVGWGDQDVDLAVRLRRSGLRCGWAGPRATVLHLWHASNVPVERPTWELLEETKRSDRIEAIEGVSRLSVEARPLPTGTAAPAGTNRRDG